MFSNVRLTKMESVVYALLRVVSGFLFLQFGGKIVFGWFAAASEAAEPKASLASQTGIGGLLEFVGGLLIVFGLLTRPVAFLLSGEMAVAYWQFHAPKGGWPIQNHGELAVLFCFTFLYMAAKGGGAWSVDALIRRQRGARTPESL